ncbi:MAG TPA: metallophosphoesterase [Spirochaetes bacterium]|nr:metallophosphoesterase [Spirochaetota bacterium]
MNRLLKGRESIVYKNLGKLYHEAPAVPLRHNDKIVIFSDIHMGDGGSRDDFLHNSSIFLYVLRHYYLKQGFKLVLNGDIEELQRFPRDIIETRWAEFYRLLEAFRRKGPVYRIIGNHDYSLFLGPEDSRQEPLYSALKFLYGDETIFVFHGHQASVFPECFYRWAGFFLKYVANPLGIKNYSVAYDNRKTYKVEKRVYEFSKSRRAVSVIGHTHRPLFESLSKIDTLKFKIERMCREYTGAEKKKKYDIRRAITRYRGELDKLYRKKNRAEFTSSVYNEQVVVPLLFNSGCVIGKRGITALEVSDGQVRLVHWFDRTVSDKYLHYNGDRPRRLGKSPYFRKIFKGDAIDYIFARVKLLT